MPTLRSTHRFIVKGHNVTAAMIVALGTLIVVGVTVLVLALTAEAHRPWHRATGARPRRST